MENYKNYTFIVAVKKEAKELKIKIYENLEHLVSRMKLNK